jgi:hypothetical protein
MISFSRNVMLLLMWIVLFMNGFDIVVAGWGTHSRVTVNITNDAGDGVDMSLACKSKTDDLGKHTLKPKESFLFSFKPNFWGTTLYYCRFQWPDYDKWFNIYQYNRDKGKGPNYSWKIGPTGACVLYTGAKKSECMRFNF